MAEEGLTPIIKTELWDGEVGFPTPGLNTTRFVLSFTKIPNVQLFANSITIPSINLGSVTRESRMLGFKEPGEKLYYEPFDINFVIGSKLEGYRELYKWMKDISVQGFHSDDSSTCSVVFQEGLEIIYHNIFPVSLSPIVLDSTQTDIQFPTMNVTFEVDRYEIKYNG